jgi:hypothetical protein
VLASGASIGARAVGGTGIMPLCMNSAAVPDGSGACCGWRCIVGYISPTGMLASDALTGAAVAAASGHMSPCPDGGAGINLARHVSGSRA